MKGVGIVFDGIGPGAFPRLCQVRRRQDPRLSCTKLIQLSIQVRSFCELRGGERFGKGFGRHADCPCPE